MTSRQRTFSPELNRVRSIPAKSLFVLILSTLSLLAVQSQLQQLKLPCLQNDDIKVDRKNVPHSSDTFHVEDKMKPFCVDWSRNDVLNRSMQPFDNWWTHNPHWVITRETDAEFCVQQGDLQNERIREFLKFYATQFYSSCKKVNWRYMWLSGWGADFLNVQAGLRESADTLHIPLTMGFGGEDRSRWYWNYAANKDDGSNKTCPTADLDCYFLPHHNCGTLEELKTGSTGVEKVESQNIPPGSNIIEGERAMSAYLFITRKQLWLRRAVYDFKQQFKESVGSESDCTIIHVRRGDVIIDSSTRRYFPVKAYVDLIPKDKLKNSNHTLFLLTDDANAIEEALEFYPTLRWKYFRRERQRGSSAGWEGHTPSRNPVYEVVTILATFDLAQECTTLVHGHSNYADYLWAHMLESSRREELKRFRVDHGTNVFDAAYKTSETQLQAFLEEMRRNKTLSQI